MNFENDVKGSLFDDEIDVKPTITVSEDRLSAWVHIPENYYKVDLFNIINEENIISGIDKDLVNELNEKLSGFKRIKGEYKIAKGSRPVDGQPGELILRSKKPEDMILSSDDLTRVDYKTYRQKQLALAEKDKPVAMIIQPTKGRDGFDVYGDKLKAKDGEEVDLVLGNNVFRNGNKIVSKIDGLIDYKKEKSGRIHFDVAEVYVVKGDVDYSTGNINFPGAVIVKGVIKPGFEVRATKEVIADTIRGKVYTKGGVISKQGIIGAQNYAEIHAEESVQAKFVQRARIFTGEDLIVKKSIISSEVYAEKSVALEGSPGSIIGGKIIASESVTAKTIGSESFVKTEVALFNSAGNIIELKKLLQEKYNISKKLLKIENYIGENKNAMGYSDAEKKIIVNKLAEKREYLRSSLLDVNSKITDLQQDLSDPIDGRITISKDIWPEVKISISGRFILIKESKRRGYFYLDKDFDIDFKHLT
jgi:uncharacterized protein (DUF342 family)